MSLREKSPSSEFFWTVFSGIRTEYGEMRIISLYSVRTQENTNQKNSEYGQCSWSVHKRDSTKWTIMNYHLPHLKSGQVIPKCYAILMCYKEVHIECRFVPTNVLLCLETCCLTVWKKKNLLFEFIRKEFGVSKFDNIVWTILHAYFDCLEKLNFCFEFVRLR